MAAPASANSQRREKMRSPVASAIRIRFSQKINHVTSRAEANNSAARAHRPAAPRKQQLKEIHARRGLHARRSCARRRHSGIRPPGKSAIRRKRERQPAEQPMPATNRTTEIAASRREAPRTCARVSGPAVEISESMAGNTPAFSLKFPLINGNQACFRPQSPCLSALFNVFWRFAGAHSPETSIF